MGNPEDQLSDEERRVAESELGIPPSAETSPSAETPASDAELAVVTKTLGEAATLGAVGEVFEQHPDAVITILRNSLFQPAKNADETLLLPILATALDSSSDLLSLHLRARLENPEIQNGERQEALTLLIYTALGSYQGDRLYSSYAFNHLAGAIASGEITHQRLEDEVNELAQKVSYSDDQKEAFLQLVEERATAYLHDAKAVLKDLSRGNIFQRSSATEEKRLDLYTAAEERDEVLDIAKDIVSNPRMLRFARATLVKQIYLDKDTELSERHRLQERLQTLAEAGSKLMDADPTTFLAEHLISYNAGEWDLCAQLVAIRDVMGNRQVAAILRTAAGEELFQDQALKMMVEVAHHNPDSSTIAATLNAMLKSGEVDEGGLLLVAQQVLGGEEVAQHFLSRIQSDSGTEGAKSSLPIPDLDKETEILHRFYEKYHRDLISNSFATLSALNISVTAEQEEKITSRLAYALYKNPLDIDLEETGNAYRNYTEYRYDKNYESFWIAVSKPTDRSGVLFSGHGGERASRAELRSLKPLIVQAATDERVIQEISLLLSKNQGERLLACAGMIVSKTFLSRREGFHREPFQLVMAHASSEQVKRFEKMFGERKIESDFDLAVAASDLPPEIINQLLSLGDPEGESRDLPPELLAYATKHPLELAPYALMEGGQTRQFRQRIYPILVENPNEEVKEACRAIQEQLIIEARTILGPENVIAPNEIQKILGLKIDLEKVPVIPFSRSELKTAKELGQFLVYRHPEDSSRKPLTMKILQSILQPKFDRDSDGKVLYDAYRQLDWFKDEPFFDKQTFEPGWALTTREVIPNSMDKNYLEQTSELASYVEIIGRDITDPALRAEYREAVNEFDERRADIERMFRERDSRQLHELKLNRMFRQTPVEAMYDTMMYFDHNRSSKPGEARLLESLWNWTNQSYSYHHTVRVGYFGSDGLRVNFHLPINSHGNSGVTFSRNQ